MTEAMVAAAAAGGVTVVQAASSDAWGWCRRRLARLVGGGDPEREREALALLDRTAAALDTADEVQRERARRDHTQAWQTAFSSLLETLDDGERELLVTRLRALEREVGDASGGGTVSGNTFNGPTALQAGDNSHQVNNFGGAG
ncbi:hypothetical protein ACIBO4_01820 [Streptomyces sp. NPDC050149]|uniref:hypothetical protein n=1 Tax=Streptomyces sp. NPDC050149 TaxID=3365603 RepID=UPI0037A9FBF9